MTIINPGRSLLKLLFKLCASGTALVTILIFAFMVLSSFPLIKSGGLLGTITSPWLPQKNIYGIFPMIRASMALSVLAVLMAFPLSFSTSALSIIIPEKAYGKILKSWVTAMTGIPTVIYGFIGVIMVIPFFRNAGIGSSGYSILAASSVLAIMISPTMILIMTENFQNKSDQYRKTSLALGADDFQIFMKVIAPASAGSMVTALVLGTGRAAGDALIALMMAGNSAASDFSFTAPARTLTSHIALIMNADFESLAFKSVFLCGTVLYCFTGLSILLIRIISMREK